MNFIPIVDRDFNPGLYTLYIAHAHTSECVICPENSYCTGGAKKIYYDGTMIGDDIDVVACPIGATSPIGSTNAHACTCNAGFEVNSLNACAKLCNAGATTLRTSTGIIVPLFANKNTFPSINIQTTENTICYADLISGHATNEIHVQYNNSTYHTVKSAE